MHGAIQSAALWRSDPDRLSSAQRRDDAMASVHTVQPIVILPCTLVVHKLIALMSNHRARASRDRIDRWLRSQLVHLCCRSVWHGADVGIEVGTIVHAKPRRQ